MDLAGMRFRPSAGPGAANPTAAVMELFSELLLNAAQHSESSIDSLACVQLFEFETASRFVCAVADGGIGVKPSLRRNPALRTRVACDCDAFELAVRERISGNGVPGRCRGGWIGHHAVSRPAEVPGRPEAPYAAHGGGVAAYVTSGGYWPPGRV